MSVTIKSPREIELMRESCRLLSEVFLELEKKIEPGITTKEIDIEGDRLIRACGCIPNFLHYEGYPASICVSVNEEVVHGIPNKKRKLMDGDIVSLDCGLIYKGYHSDMARTFAVGEVSPEVRKLMDVTKQSFFEGIKMAKAGNYLYDISNAIDDYVTPFGYGIVRELVGHGIGTSLHEEPQIPNFRQKKHGIRLEPGMTLAIEPMIAMGDPEVCWLDDDWTVVTEDGSPAAHYENTILITDGEPEILTLNPKEI
ncbi:MAG: type I methionyl aminopeptidase [Lachnospiraceae bacterium]|nr:type I methionyl aminopeptidase [Lachnospiraceae bacterium]